MQAAKFLLLDLAGTLLEKKDLYPKLCAFFERKGFPIPSEKLIETHRLLTEETQFPDKTSQDFYLKFNLEYLVRLGLPSSAEIADELFWELKNLPWQPIPGAQDFLQNVKIPKGIISNWDTTLNDKVRDFFPGIHFEFILGSEIEGLAKPSLDFYQRALTRIPHKPEEILYLGDSIRLDMSPAQKLGISVILLDTFSTFSNFKGYSVCSFSELEKKNLIE